MLSAWPVGLGDEDRRRVALITERCAWWFVVFATHAWVVFILFMSSAPSSTAAQQPSIAPARPDLDVMKKVAARWASKLYEPGSPQPLTPEALAAKIEAANGSIRKVLKGSREYLQYSLPNVPPWQDTRHSAAANRRLPRTLSYYSSWGCADTLALHDLRST